MLSNHFFNANRNIVSGETIYKSPLTVMTTKLYDLTPPTTEFLTNDGPHADSANGLIRTIQYMVEVFQFGVHCLYDHHFNKNYKYYSACFSDIEVENYQSFSLLVF